MIEPSPRWVLIGLVIALVLLLMMCVLTLVPVSALDGPDVVIESLTLNPLIPAPNQPFSITIVTRNQGNASTGASSFFDYVYLDPVDRPPTQSTAYTYRYGAGPLGAGGSSSFTRGNDPNLVFTTTGCNHVVYAWADKTNGVSETIESNNVFSQTVCVGVTCQSDSFEPDNACAAAHWLTNTLQIPQPHTFCPVGDEDWVKFATMAGVTYTIAAPNLGAHADPLLSLYENCGSVGQFGTGSSIVWRSPTSGVAYVHVVHRQPTYGPLSNYDLTLAADTTGIYDLYEPDNSCAAARDLPTDGSAQTHYFQASGDVDWVKFPIESGQTAVLVADNVGPNVNPHVQVYDSCDLTFGEPIAYGPSAQIATGSGGMFYAQVTNQGAGVGSTAFYDLSLNLTGCAPDSAESDDTFAAAKLIATTGVTQTHTTCPANDADWIKFQATTGITYLIQTSNLGLTADTQLTLYAPNGSTELAYNDDYAVSLLDSRIVWQAPANGTYYVKAQPVNPNVAGPNTHYDVAISQGACEADAYEGPSADDNSIGAVPITLNGSPQLHTFCPSGDQDWVKIVAPAPNTQLTIRTLSEVSGNDTVLTLYSPDAVTQLATNDDYGSGGDALISRTVSAAGIYYVRVVPYNTNQFGGQTTYELSISGTAPPTPTPTPTPWPTPSPTPTPPTTTAGIRTLIVVNTERLTTLHSAAAAADLMKRLYDLAEHPRVKGVVLQVELFPAVAAAYADWTADSDSLLNTDKANAVASAIRNLLLTYLSSGPDVKHIVIVGDDRVIPFHRSPDWTSKPESDYAASVTVSTTQWAAFHDGLSLTDDYYASKTPITWDKGELYLPDYSLGRLIETPTEIMAQIDAFLTSDGITGNRALVTGYDFVADTATTINSLLIADSVTADNTLAGSGWNGPDLADKQLNSNPRFDVQSINGHANHTAEIAPDESRVTAAEVSTGTANLSGAIIFTVGCHSGFNDTGMLDLAQAFAHKKANYVANTGYGWGGGGTTYSEALMRNYAYQLLLGSGTEMGEALHQAKLLYYDQIAGVDAYDVKILEESTFYGLPMTIITTGATFDGDDPFPSVATTTTLPTGSFGALAMGKLTAGLAGSFGAYDAVTDTQSFFGSGTYFALDQNIHAAAGQPIQPKFYADVSAPTIGRLRGAVFLSGIYSDVTAFNPIVVQPFNEYVTPTVEPTFTAPGWYPALPFNLHSRGPISSSTSTLIAQLGQFNSAAGTERLYDWVSFDTYYSGDPDTQPPIIKYVDGVLNPVSGQGAVKVEAADPAGIVRVLIAFTGPSNTWHSRDLMFDPATLKWKGVITATTETRYFVQAVDGAGNVGTAHNKGRYYTLLPPALALPESSSRVYLPVIVKQG